MLCTDGQYIQGEKSKGYKFTERYENVSLVRYNYPAFQGEVKLFHQKYLVRKMANLYLTQ